MQTSWLINSRILIVKNAKFPGYCVFIRSQVIDVTLVKVFKSSVRFTEVGRDGNYWDGKKILTRF